MCVEHLFTVFVQFRLFKISFLRDYSHIGLCAQNKFLVSFYGAFDGRVRTEVSTPLRFMPVQEMGLCLRTLFYICGRNKRTIYFLWHICA